MPDPARRSFALHPERLVFLLGLGFFLWQAGGTLREWPDLPAFGPVGRLRRAFEAPEGEPWLKAKKTHPFDELWGAGLRNPFYPVGGEETDVVYQPPVRPIRPPIGHGPVRWPPTFPLPPEKREPEPPPVGPAPTPPDDRPKALAVGVVRIENEERYSVLLAGGEGPVLHFHEGEQAASLGLRVLKVDHGRVLVETEKGDKFEARDPAWNEWKKVGTP